MEEMLGNVTLGNKWSNYVCQGLCTFCTRIAICIRAYILMMIHTSLRVASVTRITIDDCHELWCKKLYKHNAKIFVYLKTTA